MAQVTFLYEPTLEKPYSYSVFDHTDGIQVQLESERLTVTEEVGSIDVCVVVTSGEVITPISFTLSTAGGSAVALTDFTPVNIELSFSAGATRVCEPLSVAQDDLVEGDEFFSVTITRTDFSLGPTTSVRITIEDSDQIVIGFNDTTFTVVEGQALRVCAEIQGGHIDRAVTLNIDALPNPPNGGNAISDTTDQDHIAITNIRTFNPLPGQGITLL